MGKRSKEKRLAESAGRRKQTIQLEGFGRRTNAPSFEAEGNYGSFSPSQRPSKVSGIQLLGSYQEGSDEEDSGRDSPITMNISQNLSLPTSMKPERKLDDELAGFLAEINAIDSTTASKSENETSVAAYDPFNFDPFTQGSLLPAPWQAVLDESSGYHYYWNCETNEVQWEPPPAPAMQYSLPEPPPEPPPQLPTTDAVNKEELGVSKKEAEQQEPSLADKSSNDEEERRKAMTAKLAGLSKKERIKLLLQKNKMTVEHPIKSEEEIGAEERVDAHMDKADLAAKDVAKKDTAVGGDIILEDKKSKSMLSPEKNQISGLVSGYDSEASDSGESTGAGEDATMDVKTREAEQELGENKRSAFSNLVVDSNVKPALSEAAMADMESLFQEADHLIGPTDLHVEAERSLSDIHVREEDTNAPLEKMELLESEQLSVYPKNVNERMKELEGMKERENEQFIEENSKSIDDDVALTGRIEMPAKTSEGLVSSDSSENDETGKEIQVKEQRIVGLLDEEASEELKKKKEFAVDMFAEESDREHDEEEEGEILEDTGGKDTSSPVPHEDVVKFVMEEDVEKVRSKEHGGRKHREKHRDSEKERKSKHSEKKKAKKEKKEKKHKDHDRKHRDSDRKRRDDRHEKRTKKHSEKSHESSKSSRKSKRTERSKDEKELKEEDKVKRIEENRKAILEEIEREERRRSEYERLKKEEKEKKEEEQMMTELEKVKQEEKKKEEEKQKEDEMDDFAEMLLEGALEGDKGNTEPESERKVEAQAVDDMEISDSEGNDGKPPLPPMPPPPDDEPPLYDQSWQNGKHDTKYHEEMQSRITDLSILLFDKLEFLEVSKKGLTNFQVMFIEMETRMNDWREGALDSEYFLTKLEEIDAEICKYEETAAPDGWSCHWSSEYGMYYYYCEKTGDSTWSYPSRQGITAAGPYATTSYGPMSQGPGNTTAPSAPASAPLDDYGYGRSNMMMWRADLVEKEKAGPEDESKSTDPYRDPYRLLISKKEEAKQPSSVDEMPLPPGEEEDNIMNPWEGGNRSGASSPLPATALANPIVLQGDADIVSDDTQSHTVVKTATILPKIPRVASDSVLVASHSLQTQSLNPLAQTSTQPKGEKKKKEKRKKVVSGGLPSKKLKTVSSLVQKWQQVKQKVDEEMNENSSEDEDPNVLSQRRIEEWKKAQLESGRAARNPNFEEIKGDWREKIKKKKV